MKVEQLPEPDDLRADPPSLLETQVEDFTPEEIAELVRAGEAAERDLAAGRLRSVTEFFADLEQKRRLAS